MKLAEALVLQVGDRIASAFDTPAYRPRRITYAAWINEARTDVRVSMASYRRGEFVSAFGFIIVPSGATEFDLTTRRWMRRTGADLVAVGDPVPRDACADPGGGLAVSDESSPVSE